MAQQPALDQRRLVRAVVVQHQMDLEVSGHFRVDAIQQGVHDYERGRAPTVASALEAVIAPEHRGEGLGIVIVSAMKAAARRRGLRSLIVPVRPMLKGRYPVTPITHYVAWRRADGSPFDPWLRVHWRLGARQLAIAWRSMVIRGTACEWEHWAGHALPGERTVHRPRCACPGRHQPRA